MLFFLTPRCVYTGHKLVTIVGGFLIDDFSYSLSESGRTAACDAHIRMAYWMFVIPIIAWVAAIRLMLATRLYPRERLDQIWRVLSQNLVMHAVWGFALHLFFTHYWPEEYIYARLKRNQTGLNAFQFVVGAITAWPNFRARVQARLSSFGEPRSRRSAAAIAYSANAESLEVCECSLLITGLAFFFNP